MNTNVKYWVGLVACVLTALAGQADDMPEPWNHILAIGGVIGTAVMGYLIQRPLNGLQKDRGPTYCPGGADDPMKDL